jgi:hypothetical protein
MMKLSMIGVAVLALAGACGGKGGGASEPGGGNTCDAAATAIVNASSGEALAGASDEEKAKMIPVMTEGFTEACTEGAWSDEQRACFVGATAPDGVKACSETFDAKQQEIFGTKMMEALQGGAAADGEDMGGGGDEGGDEDLPNAGEDFGE